MSYPVLNPNLLPANGPELALFEAMQQSPVKVLQIGEGNFLRGFFDWMIHEARKRDLYHGSIAVTQPRQSGAGKLRELQNQGGLYTLIVRGLEAGANVERSEIISVFSQMINPYQEWEPFLVLAANPDLEVVVSNTTEAGLAYERIEFDETSCPSSFPARLTHFLYRRFRHFGGSPDKGLVCLPCELVEGNGGLLRQFVIRHSQDWGLPDAFIDWIAQHNRFLNSLVDRIVSGFPSTEADQWQARLGYDDTLLNTAEPYYLWVIQADETLDRILPFQSARLNVRFVDDLTPFQLRKVRILNDAHTLMSPMGLLRGLAHVRDAIRDEMLSSYIQNAIHDEIIPTLELNLEETNEYAAAVWERFSNPFIQHRLLDISMNSISKFRVRLLPTLLDYVQHHGELPARITQSWAELIRLYKVHPSEYTDEYLGITWKAKEIVLRDNADVLKLFHQMWSAYDRRDLSLQELLDELLTIPLLWGQDLSRVDNLRNQLHSHLEGMKGIRYQ